MRVLVVDDDYDLRMLCASVLRAAGIEMLAAGSAEAGLDTLEREACDLAILDMRLPGMSGLDALGVIAARWPTLPVLLSTATGDVREAEVRARGARGLLNKPFSAEELVARIEGALASSGPGLPGASDGDRKPSGTVSRRADTLQEILSECEEFVGLLRAELPALREMRHEPGLLDRTYRCACAAKGLMGFLELPGVTDAASRLADRLRSLRDGEAAVTGEVLAEIGDVLDGLDAMLSGLRGDAGSSARITHAPLPAVLAGAAETTEDGAPDAPRLSALVAELSRCLPQALSDIGAKRVRCWEVVQRRLSRSSASLTIAVDLELGARRERGGPLARAAVFEFESDSARTIGRAFAASMLAEPISGTPEEETELVEGALGELADRAVSRMMPAAGAHARASGPCFFRGPGTAICALPQTLFCFHVESNLGGFEAGILAGAILLEEGGNGMERGAPGRRRRALVVHHSAVMRKMLRRTLEGSGFEVAAEAGDGRRAVEIFRTARPDLVVLGLNMPVMGGLDALKIIRADDPGARVLICSAVAESGTARRSLRAGAVGYVTTPFEPEQLIRTVESLFEEREPSPTVLPAALDVQALGTYRVVEFLAEGGMADVYRGYDPGLGRDVALKVLKDDLARDVDFVVRFLNEARAVAGVSHPNVVSVYFAGSDRGKHFFVMEFLPGPDLEYLVRRENAVLSEHEALEYISQASRGLAAASRHGLIHCDVKPSNLVLGADGLLKVTDFGIARHASASTGRADSGPFGTPAYASPEQAMGGRVDHRSDIYSLGATLYFLIAGAPPYEGGDEMEAILRHAHDPVPRLKGASRRVNKLLARMMSKSPDARHATYEKLIAEIGRLV